MTVNILADFELLVSLSRGREKGRKRTGEAQATSDSAELAFLLVKPGESKVEDRDAKE